MTEEEIPVNEEPGTPGNDDEESPVECLTCNLEQALAALTLTTACHHVDDPDAREGCISWAESLEPGQIDDFREIARETVRKAGISGMNRFARDMNAVMHSAMLDVLNEKKETGVELSPAEQTAYKFLTITRGV